MPVSSIRLEKLIGTLFLHMDPLAKPARCVKLGSPVVLWQIIN